MNTDRAEALVAGERRRIEAALVELAGEEQAENLSHLDQSGELAEGGTDLELEAVDDAVAARLRDELAAVARAEERIARGTFGLSIESGEPIPDERLEAEPLTERTVDEQQRFERSQG